MGEKAAAFVAALADLDLADLLDILDRNRTWSVRLAWNGHELTGTIEQTGENEHG